MKRCACRIRLSGVVQGVGFRPFVHRLSRRFALCGSVANTPYGVQIIAEGRHADLRAFYTALLEQLPPLARITAKEYRRVKPRGLKGFAIRQSISGADRSALVSPDIGLCDDCLKELFSVQDRRYLYPFINCTNCGPRFSIIKELPYDRPLTTMVSFVMCPSCKREYGTIADRRYHAQPNACPECGPQVTLYDGSGKALRSKDEAIRKTIGLLKSGAIVAIKGIGGFHIACNALDPSAIRRLRERKQRPAKPFAVMAADIDQFRRFCAISALEREILSGPERPIVLLAKKKNTLITSQLAPDNNYLGAMLAYAPLHYLLFCGELSDGKPLSCLVMTSANRADEPLIKDNGQAVKELGGTCEYFLSHDRDILNRCDDSIVQVMDGKPVVLRRGRGYAPFPFSLRAPLKQSAGCGAQLKSTLCLTKGGQAFVSQYIGDLQNFGTAGFYRETFGLLSRLFCVKPGLIACDLHPDYFSTQFAGEISRRLGRNKLIRVQHHEAHLASVIAEHRITTAVIGVCFDGIGLGRDQAIWGGEFFIGGLESMRRAGHLAYVPMPGGDKATQEPYRMAISYLDQAFAKEMTGLRIPFIKKHGKKIGPVLAAARIQPIPTSSCGRLFDAVSALLGICDIITYEAQAAIRLQMFAERSSDRKKYPAAVRRKQDGWLVDCRPLFRAIVSDLEERVPIADIARRFHAGLAEVSALVCAGLRKETKINTVCLSGGVFQNKLFLEMLAEGLRKRGFTVFYNELLPANDAAISLGQAVIANARKK